MIQNLFQAVSLLRSPSQNRTVSEPKTYGFRPKNVRFWDGNHKRMPSEPVIHPSVPVNVLGHSLKINVNLNVVCL